MGKEKIFKMQDIYCATYCHDIKELPVELEKQTLDKILFCFESSPEMYKALQEFNSGETLVNLSRYIRGLKRLRALMYEAKNYEEGNGIVNENKRQRK
jgi:prephenate dehydrogenase